MLDTQGGELNFSFDLNMLQDRIERLTKFNQVQLLRIFATYDTSIINENKNGIHINLSEAKPITLQNVIIYLDYLDTQETTLGVIEKQKGELKNTYFK